jgi:hypothetical protein
MSCPPFLLWYAFLKEDLECRYKACLAFKTWSKEKAVFQMLSSFSKEVNVIFPSGSISVVSFSDKAQPYLPVPTVIHPWSD